MHAEFQFVFSIILPQRFVGPPPFHASSTVAKAWNCFAIAKADPGFQQSDDWLCCYRDTRPRNDMPRDLNLLNI